MQQMVGGYDAAVGFRSPASGQPSLVVTLAMYLCRKAFHPTVPTLVAAVIGIEDCRTGLAPWRSCLFLGLQARQWRNDRAAQSFGPIVERR